MKNGHRKTDSDTGLTYDREGKNSDWLSINNIFLVGWF